MNVFHNRLTPEHRRLRHPLDSRQALPLPSRRRRLASLLLQVPRLQLLQIPQKHLLHCSAHQVPVSLDRHLLLPPQVKLLQSRNRPMALMIQS